MHSYELQLARNTQATSMKLARNSRIMYRISINIIEKITAHVCQWKQFFFVSLNIWYNEASKSSVPEILPCVRIA